MTIRIMALACCAVVGAAACGDVPERSTSFGEAVAQVCESPRMAAPGAEATASAASRWVAGHVKDRRARAWFASLAPLPPRAKAARLRELAASVGVERCPLAELWVR